MTTCNQCRNLVKGKMTDSDGLSACRLGYAYDFLPDIHSCDQWQAKQAAPVPDKPSTAARDVFMQNRAKAI